MNYSGDRMPFGPPMTAEEQAAECRLRAILGADPEESTEDAARRVVRERDEARDQHGLWEEAAQLSQHDLAEARALAGRARRLLRAVASHRTLLIAEHLEGPWCSAPDCPVCAHVRQIPAAWEPEALSE